MSSCVDFGGLPDPTLHVHTQVGTLCQGPEIVRQILVSYDLVNCLCYFLACLYKYILGTGSIFHLSCTWFNSFQSVPVSSLGLDILFTGAFFFVHTLFLWLWWGIKFWDTCDNPLFCYILYVYTILMISSY